MSHSESTTDATPVSSKRDETIVFIFICVFLFPILSVALVGSWGLYIWLSQIIGGH